MQLDDYDNITNLERRNIIRNITREAWNSYVKYAFGYDELEPATKSGLSHFYGMNGFTPVAAMSTFKVMNLMLEFCQAKQYIVEHQDLKNFTNDVVPSDVATEWIGALLSCFALTHDELYVQIAQDIANSMEPAYQTATGLPSKYIVPKTGDKVCVNKVQGKNVPVNDAQSSLVWLHEIAGGLVEYNYLSYLSMEPLRTKYRARVNSVMKFVSECHKPQGLLCTMVDYQTGKFGKMLSSLFWPQADLYYNLLRLYIQCDGVQMNPLKMFVNTIKVVLDKKLITYSKEEQLCYAREYNVDDDSYEQEMESSGFYLGGMLALSADVMQHKCCHSNFETTLQLSKSEQEQLITQFKQLAYDITETANIVSNRTQTGLLPWSIDFTVMQHAKNADGCNQTDKYQDYSLSGELAESYFFLWRLTHNEKYRQNAWKLAQNIYKHCRVLIDDKDAAYTGIENVNELPAKLYHVQSAIFFSSTLKFLYLIFCDDDVLPLNEWFFNAVGHPLPIKRHLEGFCFHQPESTLDS